MRGSQLRIGHSEPHRGEVISHPEQLCSPRWSPVPSPPHLGGFPKEVSMTLGLQLSLCRTDLLPEDEPLEAPAGV